MTKRKILRSILFLAVALLGGFLILSHPISVENEQMTVEIKIQADQRGELFIYWLNEGQNPETDFSQDKFRSVVYEASAEWQKLSLSLPVSAAWLRVDPVGDDLEMRFGAPCVVAGGREIFSALLPEDAIRTHGVSSLSERDSDGLYALNPDGDDPYFVWTLDPEAQLQAVSDAQRPLHVTVKLLVALAFWALLFLLWWKWEAVTEIPKEIISCRELIFSLARNDFRVRFAGSALGIVWAFVQPIVTVVIYWFVFEKALNAGTQSTKAGITVPFVLWLVAGLVPWFYFSELIVNGTNALIEYNFLVKKVVFHISILPVVKAVSALFVHLFFVGFTLVLYSCYGHFPDLYMLQLLYYSFAMMVLGLGIVYLTSAVVVFFRDLSQIVNIVIQVLVWATPIMWNIDGMTGLSRPVEVVLKLNPMYYIVSGYRDALINRSVFWDRPGLTLWYWMAAVGMFVIGTMVFRKLRVHFADVL